MFLLVGKNVCKKTHLCLSSKDTHLADNGFININPCIIHTERQIATPHQNYYLFQHIIFTLHFFGPKNNIVYEVSRNACRGKIFEIVFSSFRKGWQINQSKACRKKYEFIRVLNNKCNYLLCPQSLMSLLKSSSHKMHP